jgi:competence protein ComFC
VSKRLTFRLNHYLWKSLDWLFPPLCAGCGISKTRWCIDCTRKCELIKPPGCPKCGRPGVFYSTCDLCNSTKPVYTKLRSWAVYNGPIRNAIHRLKYGRDIALGEILAIFLLRLCQKQEWMVDLIVPVPLSYDRMTMRGYNQASLLAKPLAHKLDVNYSDTILFRDRDTRSQVGLSAQERKNNVWGAFRAQKDLLVDKNILLVDDVITTGSTLNACAEALLLEGAQNVFCVTLARSG